jgi:hypothetical protein
MGLSVLSKKCEKCQFVDTCDHKKMEAVGLLGLKPTFTIMDETHTLNINLINDLELIRKITGETNASISRLLDIRALLINNRLIK